MTFDEELRRALRRKDPSARFADRVLARLLQAPLAPDAARHQPATLRRVPVRWVAAAAAASVLMAVGWGRYDAYRQTLAEAERLKREIRVALQIASEKVNDVQQKVQQLNQREF